LEEYFLSKFFKEFSIHDIKRIYIPILWTNFQIESWFRYKKQEMQDVLDQWVIENPSQNGYFTIVQHDDGPMLDLPPNTLVFGACNGNIPIPLIYEDINKTLVNIPKKNFQEKTIFCSFVGNITSNHIQPNVRAELFDRFYFNPKFVMINSGGWTPEVGEHAQKVFIETTLNSRFAFAPRGYGRSSFRFFECFQLGTIPIYIWNDMNWLPFQEKIDYAKLCIVLHVSELDILESILETIDENKYQEMLKYYDEIKYLFELEGMSNEIISIVREK